MRKTIAILSASGALLFGGAGIAEATSQSLTSPSPTATTLADNNTGDAQHDSGDKGKWGMFGLLGLFGLAGLKRRNTTDVAVGANGPAGARGHA